jgi:cytochrome subunit of sulfide dehydrogenase
MSRPPTVAAAASAAAMLLMAPAALAQDAHLARNLAATCANCHGTNGLARGEMRPLAGQTAESLSAKLTAYKSGTAPATLMHQIAKGYSDEQLKLIVAWFAAQPTTK